MFQKKSRSRPTGLPAPAMSDPARGANVPSIVSADMTFRGDIAGTSDLQVDGTLIGRIEVGHLVIAEGGRVEGDIVAKAVRVSGGLTGTINAGAVTLSGTARVQGDILHDTLAIETGAQFEGQCRRVGGSSNIKLLADPSAKAAAD